MKNVDQEAMDGFQQRTKTFSTSSIQNRLGGRKLGDGRYKKDKLLEMHKMNVVCVALTSLSQYRTSL